MEAGIIALEEKNGIETPKTKRTAKQPVDETDATPPPEESPNHNIYYFKVTKPDTTLKREFDILATTFTEQNEPTRTWKTVPFDEIPLDAIFRVRDDGVILNLSGFKRFRKVGTIEQYEGFERAKVEVFKDALVQT